VGAFVGVAADNEGVTAGSVTLGVDVGRLATSVSDSPASTVCATAVEMVASESTEDPHAEINSIHPTSIASPLRFPSSDIHISFLVQVHSSGTGRDYTFSREFAC
jgi:hypothetical protein